ncbi:tRNA methyltransferase [Thiomicrospira aerophila AL3]|uniref:tRNA U34 carboxymethyltransferase n=1 Tax=Thiomicrospira aerophila AL3 TaxID=717772 RepID=W0DY16_9GAMM|nr:tRNA 5-methoxyuridine(34)/uridine 5-oxyacetic acid(34) synthase CmoB [Thiomicrospira aerophila]AHF02153.1 tRNA methyltransferase [Thiomicrospira aerophila AL3]
MKHHLNTLWPLLKNTRLEPWIDELPSLIDSALEPDANGNLQRWLTALEYIDKFPRSYEAALNTSAVTLKYNENTQAEVDWTNLETSLRALMPWRKGPYQIGPIYIDTEWRSDLKWQRLKPHLGNLTNLRCLDVGCGSGYHLWRMLDDQPKLVIGIDPSLLFMAQFSVIKQLYPNPNAPIFFLPLPLEKLPVSKFGGDFDRVFSMGVLYHRRSPIDHIYELKRQLRKEGQLILETLVIPTGQGQLLVPEDRYAQMRNVWFIPSVDELIHWVKRCGFVNVKCVDLNQTTNEEQRTTDWMQWQSLSDFIDPNDSNKTIEGYPAPHRAIIMATNPN